MKTDTILDLIRMLSAQGATGSMLINTGTTAGAISFERGDIMSAWLGKLNGFQAINALASLRDATYNFDQTIPASEQGRLTPNERVLLRDFYGIQPGEADPSTDTPLESWEEDPAPERVIPLSSLEDSESRLPEPTQDDQDATVVRRKPAAEARVTEPVSRSFFAPALLVILLVAVLLGVAAVALVQRSRRNDTTSSVGPTAVNTTPSPAPQTEATRPDLTGNWKVINTVEQTSYKAYQNMEVGFHLSINQSGNDFTGTGEKITENGQNLPAHGRTPIQVKGTIDGDKIEATFIETGSLRKTNGRFVWRIDKGSGGLTGTFNSTAARTSGRSAATKVS
jgi:hypothetical protein